MKKIFIATLNLFSLFLSYQLFMFGLFSSYLSNELGFVDQRVNKNQLNILNFKYLFSKLSFANFWYFNLFL